MLLVVVESQMKRYHFMCMSQARLGFQTDSDLGSGSKTKWNSDFFIGQIAIICSGQNYSLALF